MSKLTVVDDVSIDEQSGRYEVTSTKVTTKHTKGGMKLTPGKYKVDVAKTLDRIIDKEPLFSHLIRKLTPIESVECPSSSTDGVNLYWGRNFLSSCTPDEQAGVLLHEVLHCAFLHLWRRKNREAFLWNIACDYAINLIVNKSFPLPPGSLLDTQYIGMSAEEIYDKLPTEKVKEQGWCQKLDWEGQGDGKQKQQQQGQGQGGNILKRLMQGAGDAAKKKAEEEAKKKAAGTSDQQKEQEWTQAFDKAFTQNYGKAPEYLKRVISQRHYIPVIDWAALVSNILSEDITDYTFSQPDRRFLDEPYILPELYSWDRVKDVVFVYDTSGSISDNDLNAFYNETIELWKQFPNLTGWSMVCDWVLHSVKEITPDVSKGDLEFKGGGGTSFKPPFEEVEKRNLHPKALFYFTDTYGDFPPDPGYPVFWLVHSYIGDNSQLRVPYGQVIKFMNKSQLSNPMQRPGSRW